MNFDQSDTTFRVYIETLSDILTLEHIRNELKDQVTSHILNWQDRVVIYQKVQFVTKRIEDLRRQIK